MGVASRSERERAGERERESKREKEREKERERRGERQTERERREERETDNLELSFCFAKRDEGSGQGEAGKKVRLISLTEGTLGRNSRRSGSPLRYVSQSRLSKDR